MFKESSVLPKRDTKTNTSYVRDFSYTLNDFNLNKNSPENLILHSTRSYPSFADLYKKHVEDFKWAGVGYHYFVDENNNVYQARPDLIEGAHALGFNKNSIGICFYAPDKILSKDAIEIGQMLINDLRSKYGNMPLIPHTAAQIKYFNSQFKKLDSNFYFHDTNKVADEKVFEKIKPYINSKANLVPESHKTLKRALENFKNCPGELYFNFK